MNLPNKLTMLRILMVPLFMITILAPIPDVTSRIVSLIIFALTALTDMLDGKIARKYNLITNFGKLMDPLADKFMVFGAMLAILVKYTYLTDVFVWVTAIVIFRELAVTSIRLVAAGAKSNTVIAAAWLGKVKTVTQVICICTILIEPVIPFAPFTEYHILSYATMAAMVIMTVWSGVDYIVKYKDFLKD
jgi:CDP-diacylglycerol--glycerol-3-phosphate 3-phosphatidyltransferase